MPVKVFTGVTLGLVAQVNNPVLGRSLPNVILPVFVLMFVLVFVLVCMRGCMLVCMRGRTL